MSDYKNALSREKIQSFIDEKRTFNLDIGGNIGKAWEYATNNIGTTLVIGLVLGLLGIIGPWLMAGLYIGKYEERVNGKPLEVGSLFRGFDHGGPIFMQLLLTIALMFALFIPMMLVGGITAAIGDSAIMGLLFMLVYFATIVAIVIFSILLFFTMPFIVFAGMDAMEAMKASANIIKNNKLTVFLFTLVAGLVGQLGAIACFVGIFFTIPIVYMAYYHAFAETFGIEKDSTDDIIDHLV